MPITKRESLILSVATRMVYALNLPVERITEATAHNIICATPLYSHESKKAGYDMANESQKETRLLMAIVRKALEMHARHSMFSK